MVEIKLAQPVHYADIVTLIQQDEPQFNLSVFEKKYMSSKKNLKIIAVKNQKIVGFIGGLVDLLPNNDSMYWAVDAVVDIHHRRQGIVTQLLRSLIYYGKYVTGIGVKNAHILKAEIKAGFKVSTHLRTFTAFPLPFSENRLKKTDPNTVFSAISPYVRLSCFETLLNTNTQTVVVLKKENSCMRLMYCNDDTQYLPTIRRTAQFYHKKIRFLVNTRHHSLPKTSFQTFALPARKPEILIYTHDFMLDLPIYFGHSDWFMSYEQS